MNAELPLSEPRRQASMGTLLSWPVLLMLGWVIYELTTQASLGVVVVCLKFGLEDLRTAWWLRRRDPDRSRGRTCFWLLLASASWKVAITAAIIMLALPVIPTALGQAGQAPALADPFQQAVITAGCGFLTSSLITIWAVARGLWLRQKLWVDARLSKARRQDAWPPRDEPPGRINTAGRLIITSSVLLALPLVIGGTVAVAPPRKDSAAFLWVFTVTVLFVFPVAVLMLRDYLQRRLFARVPSECWSTVQQENVVDETQPPISPTGTRNGYYADGN